MPNAIALLTKDHKTAKDLFNEYEDTDDSDTKKIKEISDKIFKELEVHTKIEEEIFYPSVKKETNSEEVKEILEESLNEHQEVKDMIANLRDRGVEEEGYNTEMRAMMEAVRHHADDEEEELFPKVKEEMPEKLDEWGDELEKRKKELMS